MRLSFLFDCAGLWYSTRRLGVVYYLFLTIFHHSENEPGRAEAEMKYWTMFTPFSEVRDATSCLSPCVGGLCGVASPTKEAG